MLEVFAMRIVRSIKERPVLGSIKVGNSVRTSVISFPRSPQPMYTIRSASHHFAIACCVIVFPVPNPPGIAAVPPFERGKNTSITRCPVTRGWLTVSFFAKGLGTRRGQ